MLQFSNSTRNIISGDDFVGANQTIDAFLKHLAKEDEVQATHHNERSDFEGGLGEVVLLFLFREHVS